MKAGHNAVKTETDTEDNIKDLEETTCVKKMPTKSLITTKQTRIEATSSEEESKHQEMTRCPRKISIQATLPSGMTFAKSES